ncbi:pilus assembly protein TadG-related protein [Microbispora rosea]|uniref:pilus assembly protein TadG-related protein n=1 Tax=Microbispora rosea TaxID=58117 RepID=UPI0034414494
MTRTRDRGSVTLLTAVAVFPLMLVLAGFLRDGTAKLRAGREAYNIAEEAARAGAGYVDQRAAYTDGRYIVDQAAALRAARSYLATTGHTGTATPAGTHAPGQAVGVFDRCQCPEGVPPPALRLVGDGLRVEQPHRAPTPSVIF